MIITTVIILLLIIAVITFLFLSNNNKNKDDDKNNNDIYNAATLNNLSININKLNYSEGFTEVELNIKNNYLETINIDTIKLIFKDNNTKYYETFEFNSSGSN